MYGGADYYPGGKEKWFDGKNHMPVAAEEVAEFTGIPVYQVEKNEFAFKAREPEDYVRASLVRLALCDLVNDIISVWIRRKRWM